jgi:4-hydroxybenzoate polyprenyltransferase
MIDRDVINHNFDKLRARARERSIWAVRTQRTQEIIVTVMALVLGSIMGWALMR